VAHDPTNSQLDVFVTTHSASAAATGATACAREILHHFVDAVGHAPVRQDF